MGEMVQPFEGPPQFELLPQMRLASPTSYAYAHGLSRESMRGMRTGRGSLRPTRTRSLGAGDDSPPGGEPEVVGAKVAGRRLHADAELAAFDRAGTRGRFLSVPPAYPSTEARLWDRADDMAQATGMLYSEGTVQAGQYAEAHAKLSALEGAYETLTVENAATANDIADTAVELAAAGERIHRKELYLAELRRDNLDKVQSDSAAFRALRTNADWVASKHSKFALQRAVASAERRLMNWRRSSDAEFQQQRSALDKVLQEEQRLQTAGAGAVEALEALQSEVGAAEAELEALRALPTTDDGLFGGFVDERGFVNEHMGALALDIQVVDGLPPAGRRPALDRLEARYGQATRLAAELKRINIGAQRLRADMRLAAVMGAVQAASVELLEAGTARLLLLEESGGRLWAVEGGPGEEERVFLPTGVGLTGAALSSGELLAVDGASEDDRFHRLVDAPVPNALVNNILLVPVSSTGSSPMGLLQVHNKRGGTQAFNTRDFLVARLLAEQAGLAVAAGAALHSWTTRASSVGRVASAGRALLSELDLHALLHSLTRHARELFRATSTRVYGVVPRSESDGGPIVRPKFGYQPSPEEGVASIDPPPPSAALLAEVAKGVVPVASIADAQSDARFDASAEAKRRLRTKAVMVVPLRTTSGAVVGLLQVIRAAPVDDPHDLAFTWEEEEAASMLCSLASVALANGQLAASCALDDGGPDEYAAGACGGLPSAVGPILARLQATVPCALSRLFIKVEGTEEVWAYDDATSSSSNDAPPSRILLDGAVKAALKGRRSILQRLDAEGGFVPASEQPLERGGGLVPVGPLPVGKLIGGENGGVDASMPPLPDGNKVRDVLTFPAVAREGAEPAAVVQLVNKTTGRPFTQQDEFLLRGVAAEVAVMVETGELASDGTAGAARLTSLAEVVDKLRNITAPPGQAAFDSWLDSSLRAAITCDDFIAYWASEGSDQLVPSGAGSHQHTPVTVPDYKVEMPTTDDTNEPELGLLAAMANRKSCLLCRRAPGDEHLFLPVLSQEQPERRPYGVLHIVGGSKRAAAMGGPTFSKADRRFVEDLAAHIGLFLDMRPSSTTAPQ